MPLRLLTAALGGLCLWAAQPRLDLWPLAIVGVAALALATTATTGRRGLLLGLVAGLACFVPTLRWSGIYVGAPPWLALSTLQAAYLAVLGGLLARLQHDGRVRPLAGAALWVCTELARSTTPFGGFPWARLAFSQADSPLARLASLAGAPGVSFAVALLGGWLAVLAGAAVRRLRQPVAAAAGPASRRSLAGVAGAAVLLLAGSALLPTPSGGREISVAAVQGNVPTAGLDFNAQRKAVLDNHLRLTARLADDVEAGRTPRPALVVLPENASDIDPTRDPAAQHEITAVVDRLGAPTMIGAVLQEPEPRISNVSLLYRPGLGITDRYVKRHPVPFGEYIPYRSFFRRLSDQVDLVTADFAAGSRVGLFRVGGAAGPWAVAPIICFEVAYDDLVREPVGRGARLLAVQTNNATFGRSAESYQQLAISRIRAIEHGTSVVHISTVGVSALVTPDGVAHRRTGLFTPALLTGRLPLRDGLTLADRLGRAPEGAALLLAAAALLREERRRRR